MKRLLLLLFFIVSTGCTQRVKNPVPVNIDFPKYTCNKLDSAIVEEINDYRMKLGLNKLVLDTAVSRMAASHSFYLSSNPNQPINHDYFIDRSAQFPNSHYGETVAANYASAIGYVDAWKRSPEHNEVLISTKFKEIGVGSSKDNMGRGYVVANFKGPDDKHGN